MIVGNAGDSRAVLCRKGTAVELSVDHKPEDDTGLNFFPLFSEKGTIIPVKRVS